MASANFVTKTPSTRLGPALMLAILASSSLAPKQVWAEPLIIPASCVDRSDPEFPTFTCYKVFRHFREILDMENSDTIAQLNLGQLRKLLGAESAAQRGTDSAEDEIKRLRAQVSEQTTKIERLEALLSAALAQRQ